MLYDEVLVYYVSFSGSPGEKRRFYPTSCGLPQAECGHKERRLSIVTYR